MFSLKKNKPIDLNDILFKFYNRPYTSFKSKYNCIIPCNIYQTWHTKNLPPKMKERVELLKAQNPGFKHYLFDDNDCYEFIKAHFKPDVLNAYNRLIPGAYKADLWRLCVLFIHGGIYMDIKLACVNGFKLIELTESNHFVKDRFNCGVLNSFISSAKGNMLLYRGIRQIVENVNNNYYGESPLAPTGPTMLDSVIKKYLLRPNIDMTHYSGGGYILYKNRFVISTEYPEYNNECKTTYDIIKTERYDILWDKHVIYA